MTYTPLKFMVHLEFLDEDEDQVRCTLIEDDGFTHVAVEDHSETALLEALSMMFNSGDLGDLFWPLQNEDD